MKKISPFTYFRASLSILAIVLVASLVFAQPQKAEAQLGGLGCNASLSFNTENVPVYDNNVAVQKNVKCVWDGLAWQMAHVVLHSLTTSVVNWINSGFNGSPSFLSNPQAFFADAADQATGVFLSNSGPLKALCSPFSIDIRLSLALGQTSNYNQRYQCTLSKVFAAQTATVQRIQNGSLVNVSVKQSPGGATLSDVRNGSILNNANQLSVNGASVGTIQGFLSGDFSQGGWKAFTTMVTEPQNNPYGASLQAQSDLQMQILAKQNHINNDLNRGAGFLSYQTCKDLVTVKTEEDGYQAEQMYGNSPSVTRKQNKDGSLTYQSCTTQTPGSFISASLNKTLGAPVDELNLTNEINQVVSALFSQLLTRVLSNGLLSSSQARPGSGISASQSYVNQLNNDPSLNANFKNLRTQAVNSLLASAAPAQQTVNYRNQALTAIQNVSQSYTATRLCISSKIDNQTEDAEKKGYLQNELSNLDAAIAADITPKLTAYKSSADIATSFYAHIQDMADQLGRTTTATDLDALSKQFSDDLSSTAYTAADVTTAKTAADTAKTDATKLQNDLKPFQEVCNGSTF